MEEKSQGVWGAPPLEDRGGMGVSAVDASVASGAKRLAVAFLEREVRGFRDRDSVMHFRGQTASTALANRVLCTEPPAVAEPSMPLTRPCLTPDPYQLDARPPRPQILHHVPPA